MADRPSTRSLLHVSIAACAACVAGLWLAVGSAQGEPLFDIRAGPHVVCFFFFSSHFFSLVFPAAGIWLNGL